MFWYVSTFLAAHYLPVPKLGAGAIDSPGALWVVSALENVVASEPYILLAWAAFYFTGVMIQDVGRLLKPLGRS